MANKKENASKASLERRGAFCRVPLRAFVRTRLPLIAVDFRALSGLLGTHGNLDLALVVHIRRLRLMVADFVDGAMVGMRSKVSVL